MNIHAAKQIIQNVSFVQKRKSHHRIHNQHIHKGFISSRKSYKILYVKIVEILYGFQALRDNIVWLGLKLSVPSKLILKYISLSSYSTELYKNKIFLNMLLERSIL